MGPLPSRLNIAALGAAFMAAAFIPKYAGWIQADRAPVLAGLNLAAMLTALLAVQRSATKDRTIMPPSFVLVFCSLLLFGPDAATLAAIVVALAPGLASSDRSSSRRLMVVDVAVAVLATQIAGLAYRTVTGPAGAFAWPWQAGPIAAAAIAYHITQGVLAEALAPMLLRQPVSRSWPKAALRGSSTYLVGASLAAGIVALIDHQLWQILPVALASLCLAYGPYAGYVRQLE
jgi:multisubunit Na+/H+ antiporter MnhE subunit